jgi:hypothetical protein
MNKRASERINKAYLQPSKSMFLLTEFNNTTLVFTKLKLKISVKTVADTL